MNELPIFPLPSTEVAASSWWHHYFRTAADALIVCREDGTVECVSPHAARLFQFKPDVAPGTVSIFDFLVKPGDRKLAHMLCAKNGRADTLHAVMTQRHGRPQAMMDIEVVPLGSGFALVVFKDASRRFRLEAHVNRLVTAIDVTPDVFLVTDAELCISYVNPAFQTSSGYTIEDVLGRSDEFLRAPTEQEKVQAYRASVQQGREWLGELVNLRRDGSPYLVEATVSPISDIAGRFTGYVICERDISFRKQLEDDLRRERDFVHSILHSLDGAIYTLDREFRLTHANDGWRRLPVDHGGIRVQDRPQIGRILLDYVTDASRREELRNLFEQVVASGRAQENHYAAADGSYWQVKISPWINGGRVCGLICNVTDQSHYHELQNQLFQSQKMEIIGTLAAGVAHDFNNLLQVIRGHVSLIQLDDHLELSQRKGLKEIDTAATRATEITRQLLSFSRASDEHSVVLDLNQAIQEASQLGRRTLRANVTVDLHPAQAPLWVKMDATRASQALLNLCVNAQDAMPDGGRLILANSVVKLSPEQASQLGVSAGAVFARCSVNDTGSGIDPELLPRIFQSFFTTKASGKGTGLGLSIVQRIVREAGGFIEVESVPGCGTTFHLYLPLAQERNTSAGEVDPAPLMRGSGRVMVVDDVDLLRDFARNFLEMAGLDVIVAGSGPEAIQLLEQDGKPVDLVFTDYCMPGMNGGELIEQILKRRPNTKFVLASGYLDDAIRARVSPYCADILSKPYDMREACKIIVKLLGENIPKQV